MIEAGGITVHSEMHEVTDSVLDKEELHQEWKELVIL